MASGSGNEIGKSNSSGVMTALSNGVARFSGREKDNNEETGKTNSSLLAIVSNGVAKFGVGAKEKNDEPEKNSSGLLPMVSNRVVRFGGGAVGFISEYREHRRQVAHSGTQEVTTHEKSASGTEKDNETSIPLYSDEEAWFLDEAIEPSSSIADVGKDLRFLDLGSADTPVGQDDPVPSKYRARKPLPCPVIIPQRRPGQHSRGFVRAYAPVLADCGIPQETFLYFLKDFHESSKASPIFAVIQVSGGFLGMMPEAHAQLLSQILGPVAGIGMKVQERTRANDFLYRANKLLFEPAGLIVTIVKYKPDLELDADQRGDMGAIQIQEVDVSNEKVGAAKKLSISKFVKDTLNRESIHNLKEKLQVSSSTTEGSIAMPQAASLVFPHTIQPNEGPETFKGKFKDFQKVLADYNDRRAQIRYGEKDTVSGLALPAEQTKLRTALADPNHPINNNGFKGLFSGGKNVRSVSQEGGLDPKSMSEDSTEQGGLSRQESWESGHGENSLSKTISQESEQSGKQDGAIKRKLAKVMRKDILYLLIVNMPSKEEVGRAEKAIVELPA